MFDGYTIITSIIIAIIEGITEFLPISSTGHMIITSYFLNIENKNTKILEVFIQLGSSLATLVFFYKKFFKKIKFTINILNQKQNLNIILTLLPTILSGVIFYKKIKTWFNINNVIYSLILGGFFLIISEILKPKKYNTYYIKDISLLQSIIIGFFQSLCLFPGFSRSGATIAIGILLGIKRSVAVNFSFIISIPLLIGSSLYDLMKNFNDIKTSNLLLLFIGMITSFIISLLSIKKLLQIMKNTSLIFFGIYRFIIAGLVYFF